MLRLLLQLTDGNPLAASSLTENILLNERLLSRCRVRAETLKWDRLRLAHQSADEFGVFDCVVVSDCLFFKDFHEDLLHTLDILLAPAGAAVMINPPRGGTLDLFLARTAHVAGFAAFISSDFHPVVSERHQNAQESDPLYTPDLHRPLLLVLFRDAAVHASTPSPASFFASRLQSLRLQRCVPANGSSHAL